MAICDYNDNIGRGLEILVEGMIEALEVKAKHESVDVVFSRELVELETMIGVMEKAHGNTLPAMFVGLNLLARALFERVYRNLQTSRREDFAKECREVGKAFILLLAETERRHQDLRSTKGKEVAPYQLAKELAEWVVRQTPLGKS